MTNLLDTCVGILFGMLIGFCLATMLARFIWTDSYNAYKEMHYRYDYCPYCGECLKENIN